MKIIKRERERERERERIIHIPATVTEILSVRDGRRGGTAGTRQE